MDDYLSSAATVAEAVQEASAVKSMFADADLNLQRWISNSSEFVRSLANNERVDSNPPPIHSLWPNEEEKVL